MRMINNLHAEPPIFYTDFRHMIQVTSEQYGSKVLYEYQEDGLKTWTYEDLKNGIWAFGTALRTAALPCHRIAIIGETHPAYLTTYLGTMCADCTIIPLDRELSQDQIVAFLKHAEADAIVYTAGFNDSIGRNDAYDFVIRIPVTPAEDYVKTETLISFADVLALGRELIAKQNNIFETSSLDMNRCSTLLFTSGTTGTSKGVMLSHANLIAALNASTHSMAYGNTCTFVSALPIHHTYEMMCGQLGVVAIGGSMRINDSIKHVMKNLQEFKPTTLILVPIFLETMHKKILSEIRKKGMEKKVALAKKLNSALLFLGIDIRKKLFGQITGAFGGNLTSIVCGGAPLSPELIKDFYQFGITVLEGYGITECAPLVAVNSPGKVKLHSVGLPVYGCDVKIDLSASDGESRDGKHKTGEILVKGPNVMLGYYKDEEATAAVFTEDGYFRTGDIGYLDDEGYIFITGRKKNVIILSNGKNVFPEELEEYLSKVPFIKEAVVVGRVDDGKETAITAIVVPDKENPEIAGKPDCEVYEAVKAAITNINRHLPTFKHITGLEIRSEEFEKNTSRKIKRYLVK